MGLRYMGLADSIINLAFGAVVIGGAAAAALAFGLGGREAAAKMLDKVDLAEAAEKTNPDAVDSGTSGSGRNTTGNDGGSGSGGASSANES